MPQGRQPAGVTPGDVTLYTSVFPGDLERQRFALASWAAAGFSLVSLNDPQEHREVTAAWATLDDPPPVSFRVVPRSLREKIGRPLVFLDDILAQRDTDGKSHLGIVNADVGLRDADTLRALLAERPFDLFYASRLDVDAATDPTGTQYDGGYDLFIMTRAVAAVVPPSEFCLGRPFYDYFIPCVALLHGFSTAECRRPIIDHVRHPVRYDPSELVNNTVRMANVLLDIVRGADAVLEAGESGSPQPKAALAVLNGVFGAVLTSSLKLIQDVHARDQARLIDDVRFLVEVVSNGILHFLRQGAEVIE